MEQQQFYIGTMAELKWYKKRYGKGAKNGNSTVSLEKGTWKHLQLRGIILKIY